MSRDAIDLHTHTIHSDGTSSVEELLRAAAENGVGTIALTDHDTTDGWDEAARYAPRYGVNVVPGIEVSTAHGGIGVHMLAYLTKDTRDETSQLARFLASARASRVERTKEMVERMSHDLPIDWEYLVTHCHGSSVGRPHIADALIGRGVVSNREEAFTRFLSPSSPYYVKYRMPATLDAVRAIVADGGVAVIAHAWSDRRRDRLSEQQLGELIAAGMRGIEVDHREHREEERRRLRAIAHENDLIVTGSSDYHGLGKPNRLAENQTAPEALAAIIAHASSPTEVIRP
ncbi:PHP domain-containing protein [Dermabacteraceae bacterium P13103]